MEPRNLSLVMQTDTGMCKVFRWTRHSVVCEIGPDSLNISNVWLQALNCGDLWNECVVARLMK